MKTGDIVYIVYRNTIDIGARQVKLLSEFALNTKYMYGYSCKAQFLMQYDLENGWHPYHDRHFEKTQGIYRVSKNSLYMTWEEAKEALKLNMEQRVKAQKAHLKQINESICKLQQEYSNQVDAIEHLQQIDLEKHFSHDNNEEYISPFTGLTK